MKDWLVSDIGGAFSDSELVRRLESWKNARAVAKPRASARKPESEFESLLEPFHGQSAGIRSMIAFGPISSDSDAQVFRVGPEDREFAKHEVVKREVVKEDPIRPVSHPAAGERIYLLDSLAR